VHQETDLTALSEGGGVIDGADIAEIVLVVSLIEKLAGFHIIYIRLGLPDRWPTRTRPCVMLAGSIRRVLGRPIWAPIGTQSDERG
jgi:hypothetical protein